MVAPTEVAKINGSAPSLPSGKYRLVGFDMDLTGRRLIDEIVHIAAYTPTGTFSQFVMPFKDLNNESKYRHLLRVITVGRYRMLKSDKTGRVLKTKSEISALTDFIQWLEEMKCDNIVLLTHETRKTVSLFLLETIKKYGLYERFCKVVKGFANTYLFAESKCAETVKSFSLYSLRTVLLDKDEDLDSASDRARLTYQIVQHLCAGEGSGDADQTAAMSDAIREVANSITGEELDLVRLKELVDRQNSFRPIFGTTIKSHHRFERYRASTLRRLLAEADLTYDNLETAWQEGKHDGLKKLIQDKITKARTPQDLEELTEVLLGHFDPEYTPKLPPRPRRGERPSNDKGSAAEDEPATDDKSKTSSGKSTPGKFASATSSPVKTVDEVKDADTSR